MSGDLGSSHWMYSSGKSFYDYEIDQSLRFAAASGGGYLSKTFGQDGTDWTWSAWIKRGTLGSSVLFASSKQGSTYVQSLLRFNSNDQLDYYQFSNANTFNSQVTSSERFRDTSAWYHIVAKYDEGGNTTLYVNGEQVGSGSNGGTHRLINKDDQPHYIGNYTYQSNPGGYYHGYMAEIHFVDGSLLNPTSFAETKNGIWVPKEYTGSYGNNGFYLNFSDSSALGDDLSGNGNDFTAYTVTSTDVVPDSPTLNYCVMNPLNWNVMTFTEGNLKTATTSNNKSVHSTFALPSSGKWIYEFEATDYTSGGGAYIGFSNNINEGDNEFTGDHGIFYQTYNGGFNVEGTVSTATGYAVVANNHTSDGDIHTIAIDVDNQKLYFAKNGTWRNSADPGAGTGGLDISTCFTSPETDFHACITRGGSYNESYTFNFGQDDSFAGGATPAGNSDENGHGSFSMAVPSGFLALCSANLPDPVIDPLEDEQSSDYFNTVLYTAASSNGTYDITGVGFKAGLTWVKNRNNVERHLLFDEVRGNQSITEKFLVSSATSGQGANGVNGTTVTVNNDGFRVVETSIGSGELYFNSRTYVAWNWLAGSITSDCHQELANATFGGGSEYTGETITITAAQTGTYAFAYQGGGQHHGSSHFTGIGGSSGAMYNWGTHTIEVDSTQEASFQGGYAYNNGGSQTSTLQRAATVGSVEVSVTAGDEIDINFARSNSANLGVYYQGYKGQPTVWVIGALNNTDGDIKTLVSANTKAGFSICHWAGSGTSGDTIGHGLGVKPDLAIIKNLDGAGANWLVYNSVEGATKHMTLNTTNASGTFTEAFADTEPTTSVFSLGNDVASNKSGSAYVGYFFANKDGHCKVGQYVGNGSSDGCFVHLGFRPALVLIKVTSVTNRWVLFDSKRSDTNPVEEARELNPNDTTAESSSGTDCLDFLSNGFKLRRTGDVFNTNGYKYIYLAVGEQPFKYSNAR
jgi:hypothetical protein